MFPEIDGARPHQAASMPEILESCLAICLKAVGAVESTLIVLPQLVSRQKDFVLRLRRVHDTGTEALLSQHPYGWRIQINLREVEHTPMTIVGCVAPTVELAKELSDKTILRRGHICNGSCKGWGGALMPCSG